MNATLFDVSLTSPVTLEMSGRRFTPYQQDPPRARACHTTLTRAAHSFVTSPHAWGIAGATMNTHPRKSKLPNRWTAEHDAAVQHLADAVASASTQQQLRDAVDAARDAGVGWTRIGDTLGIASGNAYQRYRKRPSSPDRGTGR